MICQPFKNVFFCFALCTQRQMKTIESLVHAYIYTIGHYDNVSHSKMFFFAFYYFLECVGIQL